MYIIPSFFVSILGSEFKVVDFGICSMWQREYPIVEDARSWGSKSMAFTVESYLTT